MPYAIKFGGGTEYASFTAVNRTDATWRIEFRLKNLATSQAVITYLLGSSNYSTYLHVIWYNSSDDVRYRVDAVNSIVNITPVVTNDQEFHDYVMTDNGTDLTLQIDGGDVITNVGGGGRPWKGFSRFARTSGAYSSFELEYLRYFNANVGGTAIHDWDATNSNHAAGAVVLKDFGTAGYDATGIGMPSDGSAWINYGGAPSPEFIDGNALSQSILAAGIFTPVVKADGQATVLAAIASAVSDAIESGNGSATITNQASGSVNDITLADGLALLSEIVPGQILNSVVNASAVLSPVLAIGTFTPVEVVDGQATVLAAITSAVSDAIESGNGSATITNQASGSVNDITLADGLALLSEIVPGQIFNPTITASAVLSPINADGTFNSVEAAGGQALSSQVLSFGASVAIEFIQGTGVLQAAQGATKLQIDFNNLTVNLGAHIIQVLPSNHITQALPSNHIIH